MMSKGWKILLSFFLVLTALPRPLHAWGESTAEADKQHLYETMQTLTGVPWAYLAAMDQYEKNSHGTRSKKENADQKRLTSIEVPPSLWAGLSNPDQDDRVPESISFFRGIGKDANGDGKADPHDDIDVLYSVAFFVAQK
jgi:hypothetical protein